MSENFIVITGGPSGGKTTLIEHLVAGGYASMPEAGRALLQAQAKIADSTRPWSDPALAAELTLSWELRSHRAAADLTGPVFFDRGVPDLLAMYLHGGLPVPEHVQNAADRFRYRRQVFIAPPWREIFTQDEERTQTYGDAVSGHEALVEAYTSLGYELVTLPRVNVAERACFVLEKLAR